MTNNNNFIYHNVTRSKDDILYMAYYFPQFHIAPENKIAIKTVETSYTDWDLVKCTPRSFTPLNYYNLANPTIYDEQDERANKYKIGVFIFYHYWFDNSMILSLPLDLYIQKKRKTKFILCWDNQSGYLGKQYYNKPEKHAYALLKYFMSENYLTDKNGKKPFLIYLTKDLSTNKLIDITYLTVFLKFLKYYDINLKIGYNYQKFKNNFAIPDHSDICVEFGPHMGNGKPHRNTYEYSVRTPKCPEYWQGAITSWDSRPRAGSVRTHQKSCHVGHPNGNVSVSKFKAQLSKIKKNIVPNNKDKIITIFAWNEWSEGATLEESVEYGNKFIECL